MKKSNLWLILIIAAVGLALMSGIFIGRITSGARIHIEKNEENSEDAVTSGPLDINTATVEDFVQLPGIGESLAQRIIDYREQNGPFKDVEDLLNVSGIGESKLNRIINYIKVGG